MLSRQLEVSLRLAVSMARQKRHEFLTVEHLLLALLDNDSAVNALKAARGDIIVLRKELEEYVEQHTPKLGENSDQAPHPTESFDRILQRAIFHVQSSGGDRTVEGADILVAMYSERDSFAVYLLKRHQINRLTLTQYSAHGTRKDEVQVEEEIEDLDGESTSSSNAGPLELYTTNLNVEAQKGKTDPLIGREKEIERAAQILCRRRKNNPLLVGDPGVGKTSIAEGLAWLIVNGKAPKPLANAEVYSLDIGELLHGRTKYRGDFEKRLKQLLNALKKKPEAVLFIDEIHMIIGAGSSMGSTMDASNLIKPALANGSLRCIGSTTFQEYRQVFEDHALSRRFQKIDVNEPSISETIDILRGLKSKFEDFHHVKYDDKALISAVELSAKFINDRFLPDKAIDVIDEAGAQRRLKAEQDDTLITVENIEDIVSKIARIPPKTVSKDDKTGT